MKTEDKQKVSEMKKILIQQFKAKEICSTKGLNAHEILLLINHTFRKK